MRSVRALPFYAAIRAAHFRLQSVLPLRGFTETSLSACPICCAALTTRALIIIQIQDAQTILSACLHGEQAVSLPTSSQAGVLAPHA